MTVAKKSEPTVEDKKWHLIEMIVAKKIWA